MHTDEMDRGNEDTQKTKKVAWFKPIQIYTVKTLTLFNAVITTSSKPKANLKHLVEKKQVAKFHPNVIIMERGLPSSTLHVNFIVFFNEGLTNRAYFSKNFVQRLFFNSNGEEN